MSAHALSRLLSFPFLLKKASCAKSAHAHLAASSAHSFVAPLLCGGNKTQKRFFAHGAATDLTVACRTSTVPRPNNGPTTSMNLFTAVNSAMHIALETDPTYVPYLPELCMPLSGGAQPRRALLLTSVYEVSLH